MSVSDSTNKWHQGNKKRAADNAVKAAVFRKNRTRPPLTAAEIERAVQRDKEQRASKNRVKGTTFAEYTHQRKKRILVANILHARHKEQPPDKEPRSTPSLKTVSFTGKRAV